MKPSKVLMFRRYSVLLVCALCASTHSGTGQEQIVRSAARSPDFHVDVKKVLERSTPNGEIVYEIDYSYEFKTRDSVYVPGLGTIPSVGRFSYLTYGNLIDFKESSGGLNIATVRLEETVHAMGSEPADLPRDVDFPESFRSSTWTPPITFPQAAIALIQKYFPSGYNPRQIGQVNYYVSTYRNLQVADRNRRSQIAINISQPYDAETDRISYRVQFVTRDRPRLSDTWNYGVECSQQTVKAGQAFVNRFISELGSSTTARGSR